MNRRDRCWLIGRRASGLDRDEAATAWADLAKRIEDMGTLDVPKFEDVIRAIRLATISGRSKPTNVEVFGIQTTVLPSETFPPGVIGAMVARKPDGTVDFKNSAIIRGSATGK